jgi:hypothetical protein
MKVTQSVTPTSVRIVVVSSHNDLYVAKLSTEQLEKIIDDISLVWRRGKRSTHVVEDTEKETENGNSQQQASPER